MHFQSIVTPDSDNGGALAQTITPQVALLFSGIYAIILTNSSLLATCLTLLHAAAHSYKICSQIQAIL
jgi:hypothetical protein